MEKNTPLSVPELNELSQRTLEHYNQRAEDFFAGTRDHDVSQNIAALLQYVEVPAPFTLLDLGCGPGRDLKTLSELGHRAVGVDGSARFAEMARAYSGCEVWQQDFLKLDLPAGHFDGVYANASLFHVPSLALPRVLQALHAALKSNGVLFSSNPRGNNEEGWNQDRYGAYRIAFIRRTGTQNKIRDLLAADKPCWTEPPPWRLHWGL